MNKDLLSKRKLEKLKDLARFCRGDIIKMTTIAESGHPAGSLSSIDIYVAVFSYANISPKNTNDPKRDRIIVSHGHTSPALYACLARNGFFDVKETTAHFRSIGSPFEGHVERHIPGVEWTTGNLGQGLSAGCGFALATHLRALDYTTYVLMSDAEQAKGQVGEARRFARKFNLTSLTVVIDRNHFQISGKTEDVMPVRIRENYEADGWKVLNVSGHDFDELYQALNTAQQDKENPYAIVAETVMGRGVSFMENKATFHGKAATREECTRALAELRVQDNVEELLKIRAETCAVPQSSGTPPPTLKTGQPCVYKETAHPRLAFGNALADIGRQNPKGLIAVFDCDLADSVKVTPFAKECPECFFETGVSEHNTATIAGALSLQGITSVWADFGVFALDEVYNQLRLNAINNTHVKIIATHLGYNVGKDGKTHHCIDYLGILRNFPGFRFIMPCDPNQTDHITRYVLKQPGNYIIGLTRTKLPIIRTTGMKMLFDEEYKYTYGTIDLIRDGSDCTVFTYGPMVSYALTAWERLNARGIHLRIYNVPSPLHIEKDILCEAAETKYIIAYEDHLVTTGLGSILADMLMEQRINSRLIKLGIGQFGGSDDADILYKKFQLDADALVRLVESIL